MKYYVLEYLDAEDLEDLYDLMDIALLAVMICGSSSASPSSGSAAVDTEAEEKKRLPEKAFRPSGRDGSTGTVGVAGEDVGKSCVLDTGEVEMLSCANEMRIRRQDGELG